MSSSDDLRVALADLSNRERDALHQHVDQAAQRWGDTLPRLGAVWSSFGALIAEITDQQQARTAAARAQRRQQPR